MYEPYWYLEGKLFSKVSSHYKWLATQSLFDHRRLV